MAIRRDAISRNIEARKASVPTIAKGKPLDARGSEGDMAFRRTSAGLKLYIKANHKWHGVKVGESFDSLEKKINEIKSKVDTIKQFRLPSTYSVTGDFTLDASGTIELNTDGGRVSITDDTASRFLFDGLSSRLRIYDHVNSSDYFTIQVNDEGATTLTTHDADTTVAHLSLVAIGDITLDAHNDVILDPRTGVNKFLQSGDTDDFCSLSVSTHGATTIATVDAASHAADLTLDVDGTINIDSEDGLINFKNSGTTMGFLTSNRFRMLQSADQADTFTIDVFGSGATTIATVDDGAAIGHITLQPDGDLILDPASQKVIINSSDGLYFDGGGDTLIESASDDTLRVKVGGTAMMVLTEDTVNKVEILSSNLEIDSGQAFYLDGGGDTYIVEHAADHVRFSVGGDVLVTFEENGDDGNQVNFMNASVGFNQLEPTYDATNTFVDFRHSNKQNLTFGSGSITNLNLNFPGMSGNFVLLLKQDGTGSRTISNYKAMEYDESAADGSAAVVWAGGSAPTLTTDANHVDILSFYWDADNEIAYGVATLDFQF
tara:strand:- start:56 stop:1696 length:1641 start_codon:yes stop_codon:yes gene_type:complete